MIYLIDYFMDGVCEGWGELEAENEFECLEMMARYILSQKPDVTRRMSAVIAGDSGGRFGIKYPFSRETYWLSGRDLLDDKIAHSLGQKLKHQDYNYDE